MRSALAARMYAAVQLSSQQQQMYVEKIIIKGTTKQQQQQIRINKISKIYQNSFSSFVLSICIRWLFFLSSFWMHIRENERGKKCARLRVNSLIEGGLMRGGMLITHDDDDDDGARDKAEKNQRREIFLICAVNFFFFCSLAFGICTIARRAYRWRKKREHKSFFSLLFFPPPLCVKNQKLSIDGQAMKAFFETIFFESLYCDCIQGLLFESLRLLPKLPNKFRNRIYRKAFRLQNFFIYFSRDSRKKCASSLLLLGGALTLWCYPLST